MRYTSGSAGKRACQWRVSKAAQVFQKGGDTVGEWVNDITRGTSRHLVREQHLGVMTLKLPKDRFANGIGGFMRLLTHAQKNSLLCPMDVPNACAKTQPRIYVS
jgi:hypothetical protein